MNCLDLINDGSMKNVMWTNPTRFFWAPKAFFEAHSMNPFLCAKKI